MRLLLCCVCLLAAWPAAAHDTWFRWPGGHAAQQLSLGTGQRYPQHETAVAPAYLERQGCRPADAPGGERFMQPLGYEASRALRLLAAPAARSCWVQLVPLDVEIPPPLVDTYLREIHAGPNTWAAWRAQREAGLPWRERYVKHARIDLGPAPMGSAPVPLGMDLVQRPGGQLQVLRDGQPLAGQAVELLGEAAPFGLWRRSGDDGLLALGALPAGRWLARAVDLRPQPGAPGQWDSRFVTLAFERP